MRDRTSKTTQAAQRRSVLGTERGAAVLLTSYLVSFTILVLTTALFVRSSNEMRMAERSAGMAQAFWGAEAAMDAAVADLKTESPPVLALTQCTDAQTTGISGATYRLCLEATDTNNGTNRYRIEATGTGNGSTETLASVVETGPSAITFDHAAYVRHVIGFYSGETASLDTDHVKMIVKIGFNGDLATAGETIHMVNLAGNLVARQPGIWLSANSTVNGNAYVGPDAGDPADAVHIDSSSQLNGTVKTLKDVKPLPPVTIPSNAKDLGDITLFRRADGSGTERLCLAPGTYVARNLLIGAELVPPHPADICGGGPCPDQVSYVLHGSPELCTTGPVDLYVKDRVLMVRGSVYGQPQGSAPFDAQYSSKNLRIFAEGHNGKIVVNSAPDSFVAGPVGAFTWPSPTMVTAALYAPDRQLGIGPNSVWAGGAIVRSVHEYASGLEPLIGVVGKDSDGLDSIFMAAQSPDGFADPFAKTSSIFYDQALKNQKFRMGTGQVRTLIWQRVATPSATATKTVDVLPQPTTEPVGGCQTP